MKVRAIAAASPRSSVVGTVEMECTPAGLMLVYLGASAFTEGYAPGLVLSGADRLVPWSEVTRVETDEEAVFVEVAGRASTSQRLLLLNFSTGNSIDHHELYRRRLIVRVLAASLAVVLAITLSLAAPRLSPGFSAASALAFGGVGALVILFLGFVTDRWLAFGGADQKRTREAFIGDLALYFPHIIRSSAAARSRRSRRPLPPLDSILPRTTAAVVVTMASLSLAALVMGKWVTAGNSADVLAARPAEVPAAATPPPPPSPQTLSSAPPTGVGVASPSPAPEPPVVTDLQLGDACLCKRADSVLWRDAIPRLTTLLIDSKRERKGNHDDLSLELAAINNGDEPLSELTLRVEFYEQDPPPSLKLYRVSDRTLYYQGPLAPAKAIKWSVSARGTHFKVLPPTEREKPITGDIGPGGDNAAPANLLAELLQANHRPVRLHGAMMLAYLGDPRARSAATELRRALREDEGTYLERVLRATAEVRVCEFQALPSEVRGCIYNTASAPQEGLSIQLRVLASAATHRDPVGPPPQILKSWTWALPQSLGAQQGRRFRVPLDSPEGLDPAMLEVIADRSDLLN